MKEYNLPAACKPAVKGFRPYASSPDRPANGDMPGNMGGRASMENALGTCDIGVNGDDVGTPYGRWPERWDKFPEFFQILEKCERWDKFPDFFQILENFSKNFLNFLHFLKIFSKFSHFFSKYSKISYIFL